MPKSQISEIKAGLDVFYRNSGEVLFELNAEFILEGEDNMARIMTATQHLPKKLKIVPM